MTLPVIGTVSWMSVLLGILLGMFVLPRVRALIGM